MGNNSFTIGFGILQIIFGILYGIFTTYDNSDDSLKAKGNMAHYALYQNVHVMIFIGFGYLMTFLGKNGFTAVGHTLVVSCVAIEWWILCGNFFQQAFDNTPGATWKHIELDVANLIQGDFAAAAVLISFGALIGRVSLGQMIFLTMVEVFFYCLNGALYQQSLMAVDVGGSVILHAFGAYYGLSAAMVLNRGKAADKDQSNNGSNMISDLFSLVGTVFLFMFWPSFTAGLVKIDSADQNRTFINTLLAIVASVIATYIVSPLVHEGKTNMVEVQNATLAGGVSIGTACVFKLQPVGAICVGTVAGIVSTIGYRYIQPKLQEKIGLLDSCGVHNLHGMPGIIGGLTAVIGVAVGAADGTGAPFASRDGTARSNSSQAAIQLAGLVITLLIAIVAGSTAGFIASKFEVLSEFYHDIAEYNTTYYPTDCTSAECEAAEQARPSNSNENYASSENMVNKNYGTVNGDQSAPLIQ